MKIFAYISALLIAIVVSVSFVQVMVPSSVLAGSSVESDCDPAVSGGCLDVCGAAGEPERCDTFIRKYINPMIRALTALVGVAAVISIIIAGIQYSASADDSGMVAKAKQRIFNVIIGLVAYVFLLALLNYLVPGGIW